MKKAILNMLLALVVVICAFVAVNAALPERPADIEKKFSIVLANGKTINVADGNVDFKLGFAEITINEHYETRQTKKDSILVEKQVLVPTQVLNINYNQIMMITAL